MAIENIGRKDPLDLRLNNHAKGFLKIAFLFILTGLAVQ